MPIIEQPFHRVAVDIIGPIVPSSERGFRFVLVMVDFATRYPDATPLKNIDSASVAEALFTMWTRVGAPEEVLTDRGSQFTSETMDQVFHLLAIKGLRTTPYHAQANGLVERFNATLKAMLRKLCRERPRDWDRFIPAALFAYREVPQESLGFSPFELLYGRTVRGPISVLKDLWTREISEGEVRTTAEHVVTLRNRIAETCELAHQNLAKAADKQARIFDKRTTDRSFNEGDQVLLLLPEKHNKLQLSWRGPFVVKKRVGLCDYQIDLSGKLKLFHANLLKAYTQRATVASAAIVVEEEEVKGISGEEQDREIVPNRPEAGISLLPLKSAEYVSDVHVADSLNPKQKADIAELCEKHKKQFTDIPLRCSAGTCEIALENQTPVYVKQYPLPHSQGDAVKQEVKSMLELGVIEPASSPYSSPILLVKKKDGTMRFCVDFRRLNKVIRFDAEPLPDIDALFARLGKAKYFSKLDLSRGYWQIPMSAGDKCKTAFTTPAGQFQFVTMPFGLKTAGAVFSRVMRRVLEPLQLASVQNFMDDVLIATETWPEHLSALEIVLTRLKEVNLSVRPKKCFLGYQDISFLGHQIGAGVMRPEQDKVEKLQGVPRPETKKQLRSFLGLSGYYRRFVPNYSVIALPLTELTKKSCHEKVEWDERCERAFVTLKSSLSRFPVVVLPDQALPFVIRTDASGIGLGAVLLQDQGAGLQPIAYASKKLSGAEKHYATIELECYAVVWGIRKFYPYLYGRQFVVETDHHTLQYLDRIRPLSRRLMGWAIELQSHSFRIRSIPGKDNVIADYLSRL